MVRNMKFGTEVKYLGLDDSVQTCQCCGKSPLKHTVGLEIDGEVKFYGTTCAGRALGGKTRTAGDVSALASKKSEDTSIKDKVDRLNKDGGDFVYGRFYVNRRICETHYTIKKRSDLLVRAIYPE